jgi:formylglycine-generating enzyme required for sulfatase activity
LIDSELATIQVISPERTIPDLIEVLMSVADAVSSSTGNRHQHAGMLLIPGGTFRMGSDRHIPRKHRFIASQSTRSGWIARR